MYLNTHTHTHTYTRADTHTHTHTHTRTRALTHKQGWDSYFSFEAINIIATNFKNVGIIASLLLKFR
jgi:hypothetical protein